MCGRCAPLWLIPTPDSFARRLTSIRGLRATRIYQMIRDRGYSGSIEQLRRTVSGLRPVSREPFLELQVFSR